jgi:hypothetical protein
MNIQIKRNTFVEPGQSRQHVVQKICDIIISKINDRDDYLLNLSGPHPRLFIVENKNTGSAFLDGYARTGVIETSTRIRSCEMRLALRFLQDAGYYVFSNGWDFYFSSKPQRGLSKAERQEFKLLID